MIIVSHVQTSKQLTDKLTKFKAMLKQDLRLAVARLSTYSTCSSLGCAAYFSYAGSGVVADQLHYGS